MIALESLRAVVVPLHENDHSPLEYCQDSFMHGSFLPVLVFAYLLM
jgi:hypothetical protein